MQGAQQIKGKRVPAKRTSRIPAKEERTPATFNYQDNSSNYLITVNVVQPHKSSDKNQKEGRNEQKIKKLKFITEEIEKSTQDMLEVRSHSNQKQRSLKHDSQNIEDEHAYQICRANKKSQKSHQEDRKSHNRDNHKDNFPLGNLKTRKAKHQSKDHPRLSPREPLKKPSKSNKKLKADPKTSRKSAKQKHQRQYLSPDLVQLQNSYYFSNNEEEGECSSRSQQLQPANPAAVRRERKYIFESNQNVWQEKPSKAVTNSILNPLSDY